MEKKAFSVIEENVKDAPVSNLHWHGEEAQTDEQLLMDEGRGEPVVLRPYVFKLQPGLPMPTSEQILTREYIRHLEIQLWADGLKMVLEPKVVFGKDEFTVFVTTQARPGQTLLEKPKLIQEYARTGN